MRHVLILVLALLGLIDTSFLIYESFQVEPLCSTLLANWGVASCSKVTSSQYGWIEGIPISVLGWGSYLAFFHLSLQALIRREALHKVLIVAFLGFLFSLYLIFVQAFFLETWCFFCLISASLVSLIFLLAVVDSFVFVRVRRVSLKKSFYPALKVFIFYMLLSLALFEMGRGRFFYEAFLTQEESKNENIALVFKALKIESEEFSAKETDEKKHSPWSKLPGESETRDIEALFAGKPISSTEVNELILSLLAKTKDSMLLRRAAFEYLILLEEAEERKVAVQELFETLLSNKPNESLSEESAGKLENFVADDVLSYIEWRKQAVSTNDSFAENIQALFVKHQAKFP